MNQPHVFRFRDIAPAETDRGQTNHPTTLRERKDTVMRAGNKFRFVVKSLVAAVLMMGMTCHAHAQAHSREITRYGIAGFASQHGAYVSFVDVQKEAWFDGIRPGDVIVACNGRPIFSVNDLLADFAQAADSPFDAVLVVKKPWGQLVTVIANID
jgi:S1-C subfamily serine protease